MTDTTSSLLDTSADRLQPGDIKIVSAVVVNKRSQGTNIKEMILELKIFENIFSPFITASMTVIDAIALSNLLPFVGEELLVLELQTPTKTEDSANSNLVRKMKRTLTFHVYKMQAEANIAMKSKIYTINMISVEGLTDMNSLLSQRFNDKVSALVETIMKGNGGLQTTKDVVIEETTNKITYVSNFWSPTKNIFYLAENAVTKENSPSYLFFENNEGFIFASVETLLSTPVLQSFFKDQKSRNGQELPNVDEEYSRILDISTSDTVFDYIDRKRLGAYGSTIYELSFDMKGIRKITLSRGDNPFDTTVDATDTKVANPASIIRTIPVHRNLFNGSTNLAPGHHSKRALILKNLENIKTNIQVFGRLDYTAGRVVNLTIYKDQQVDDRDSDERIVDKLYSGNYLITALCHVITRDSHYTNMELSKASTIPA